MTSPANRPISINTYSGVMVDDGNNIGVSIVGGRSGTAGVWDTAPTQRYGYAFGSKTDYCGPLRGDGEWPYRTGPLTRQRHY